MILNYIYNEIVMYQYIKGSNYINIHSPGMLQGLKVSRLAAKLSGLIAKFRGHYLNDLRPQFFDLNGLKNGSFKYFKNSLKSRIVGRDH